VTLIAVVDLETTGIDPAVDRVVEAARVTVDADTRAIVTSGDQWRFHPGERGVPPEASAVHHLTLADLTGRPPFTRGEWSANVAPTGDYLAAHNVEFDRGFIDAAPVAANQFDPGPEARPWICTLKCARAAWPEAPAHGNQVMRYWLGLTPDLSGASHAHSALYDAIVTAHLLLRLLDYFNGDLARMVQVSSEPSLLRAIGFGKHRGTLWSDAPKDYLSWVLKQDFGPDEKHTARHYLWGTTA
jgi:exodeoxyribonuclease X